MTSAPHYLRFAQALALASTIGGCAASTTVDPECQNCAYYYGDCDGGGPGPFPDTGVVPTPSCSPACYARHDANIGICGPLPPPELAA